MIIIVFENVPVITPYILGKLGVKQNLASNNFGIIWNKCLYAMREQMFICNENHDV